MTKEQINDSLDAMLSNPKAKTFLNHIIRSYMPASNVTEVLKKPKGDFKCLLTRVNLISTEDINNFSKSESFQLEMKNSSENLSDSHDVIIKKVIGEREFGVTGKETTTFMSKSAYTIFGEWVVTKSLNGDKHINWVLGSIKRSSLIPMAININDDVVKTKVAAFKKHDAISKPATFTLSDSSDVLSKLKATMEVNNK